MGRNRSSAENIKRLTPTNETLRSLLLAIREFVRQ